MRNFENTSQYIRNNSVPTKVKYRDYHDFLDSYNSQKKDDQESVSSNDSGIAGSIDQKLYSLSESKSNSTSSSSINGDLNEKIVKTEAPKAPATSYRQFLENYNKKKFSSVKPSLEQPRQKVKSEIFIQINEPVQNQQNGQQQKNRVINEIKATFEKTTPPKINKENDRIVKEVPTINKGNGSVVDGITTSIPTPPPPPPLPQKSFQMNRNKSLKSPSNQPPPPPLPPQPTFLKNLNSNSHKNGFSNPPPKQHQQQQQTMIRTNPINRTNSFNRTQNVNPQTHTIYRAESEVSTIDKNDPNVKKLVYNTYRGLLGAYNNKANDFISTLPRTMVRQDKGISKQVESIKLQGGLEKLNGRINPNPENENLQ